MVRSNTLIFGSIVIAASAGCSFSTDASKNGTTGTVPTPDGGFNGDVALVEGGGGGGDLNGEACGGNMAMANHLPPDLLIVLDRSGSMNQNAAGMACNMAGCTKWDQMTAAINQVVASTQASINWGLMMFGSGTSNQGNQACAVRATANVPPAIMTAGAIAAAIVAGSPPVTSTPTRAAELSAAAYLRTLTDTNPKIILLATDGQPNCAAMGGNGAVDDPAAIAAVGTVLGMGIPTYVIGVGNTGADATLNSMAMAGGHPQPGSPQYYPVANTADLAAALTMIQGMVNLPCKFGLNGMVTDPGMVSVTIGGVKADPSTFTLDPGGRGITFTGATCDMLTAGNITNVAINIGCQRLIP